MAKTKVAKVTTIKNVSVKRPTPLLQDGQLFLIYVEGYERYWSKDTITVAILRGQRDIEIPKGSPYIPPKNGKCKGCG